jgi:hypothetical protein
VTKVALKVLNSGTQSEAIRAKLPFATVEGGVVVVRSQLGTHEPLNAHLVWLWGILKHERRILKSAVAAGAHIVCECVVPKGPIHVLPNGAEFLHLLGAELLVQAK